MAYLVASGLFLHMGHVLNQTLGQFHPSVWLYTLLYFFSVPFLIKRVRFPSEKTLTLNSKFIPNGACLTLGCVQLLFLHWMIKSPHILYQSNPQIEILLNQSLTVALGVSFFLVFVSGLWIFQNNLAAATEASGVDQIKQVTLGFQKNLKNFYPILALCLIVLLLCTELLVPELSPRPWIDVFVNNTAAVDFFLSGKNPYSQTYVDIYNGFYSYKPGFLYFPGVLFLFAPFRALFGDIRFTFIFAQILNVFFIYRIASRRSSSPLLPWLLPILWLSFPITLHVLEQSWTDTLLIAFTFFIVDAIDLRRWLLVGILAGLVFTCKQYGFIISIFALLRVAQVSGWSIAFRTAGIAAGSFFAVMIPFLLADFKGFYAMTIQAQVDPGIRADSFGMSSFFVHEWGYLLPSLAQAIITLSGIVGGVWIILSDPFKKTDRLAISLFFSYGCAFLFGKWAFCNYHYLLASFLMLYLATGIERYPDTF